MVSSKKNRTKPEKVTTDFSRLYSPSTYEYTNSGNDLFNVKSNRMSQRMEILALISSSLRMSAIHPYFKKFYVRSNRSKNETFMTQNQWSTISKKGHMMDTSSNITSSTVL